MTQPNETALIQHRYDRIASFYDAAESLMELRFQPWRRSLLTALKGHNVLEVGVGTGKNLPYYPADIALTGIDISEKMLEYAEIKAQKLRLKTSLLQADAQSLPFPDNSFDAALVTFVLCSVPEPKLALRELRRVVAPGGQILILEHVLSERWLLRRLMQLLSPLTERIWGASLDRETEQLVREAGFTDLIIRNLSLDIIKRIEGRVPSPRDTGAR